MRSTGQQREEKLVISEIRFRPTWLNDKLFRMGQHTTEWCGVGFVDKSKR